ncbi:zincin-like metallopeptidase domain-containing protein [Candidatus Spongiihabitans sp.]|uniref:zincin-like metallopeptidase domain-containing protein n=1 Tax=Candidatus Spongiihabitans sp. TaxID=3101308 RepID=UPI003C79B3EF
MPKIEQFNNSVGYADGEAHYWATLWHEVEHWTGHENRLNRTLTGRFGDPDYAFEELIAELGTAFLCARMGIKGELQHASYIKSWLEILKNNPDSLWDASRHAYEAYKYIFDPNREPKLMPYYR